MECQKNCQGNSFDFSSVLGGAVLSGISADISKNLIDRLTISDDGKSIAGDNRSWRMVNAWDQIAANPEALVFGLDKDCIFNYDICQEKYPPMGENPLSPLAFSGIAISWPYYVIVVYFLVAPLFGKKYLVVLGMGLLFLQRPYLMNVAYSFVGILIAYLTMISLRKSSIGVPESIK